MAAVDAAIVVQLVDHDVAQILEALRPAGVMRQDAAVQHVRIGQHDVGALADGLARVLRRVAVVGEGADVGAHRVDGALEFVQLILGQRLGGEQIHGARVRIAQQQVQHRQVVAERLAAGGGRDDDRVGAGADQVEGFRLVGVEPGDAAALERGAQAGIERRREIAIDAGGGGLVADGAHRRFGRAQLFPKMRENGIQTGSFGEGQGQVHVSPFLCQDSAKRRRWKRNACRSLR